MYTQDELGQLLAERFKLDTCSEGERAALCARAGELVLESAIGRLLLTLSEAKRAELELYLDTHTNDVDIIAYLLEAHPTFGNLLEEEAHALQREALLVVSEGSVLK